MVTLVSFYLVSYSYYFLGAFHFNFKRGEFIQVLDNSHDNWKQIWNRQAGMFPGNYVTQVDCE